MKKVYRKPELELLRFEVGDIITASSNDMPFIGWDENENGIPDDEE